VRPTTSLPDVSVRLVGLGDGRDADGTPMG